jgi:hypothetical protein
MRLPQFSFKSEAFWLLGLTLVPAGIALIAVFLIPWLLRALGWR